MANIVKFDPNTAVIEGLENKGFNPTTAMLEKSSPESISSEGLGYIAKHPFKTVLEGGVKTLTGKSLETRTQEATAPEESMDLANPVGYATQVAKQATAGTIGGIADAFTAPVNYMAGPVLKVAGKAIGSIPEGAGDVAGRLHDWMVKLPTKAFNYGKDPLKVMNEEKVTANSIADLAQAYQGRLSQRTSELNDAVQQSSKTVNLQDIVNNNIQSALKDSSGSLKESVRNNVTNKIADLGSSITDKYGDLNNLSLQKAIKLKRQLADDFPFSGNTEDDIVAKAAHRIHHAINDAIETAEPGIAELNQKVSGLIDVSKAAKNRMAIEARNNPLGLIHTLIGGGVAGGAIHGVEGAGAGLGAALLAKAVSSPAVLTRVAKGLSMLSDLDKIRLFKASPEFVNVAEKAHEYTGGINKAGAVDAELVGPKGLPAPENKLGLPDKSWMNGPNQNIRPIDIPNGTAVSDNPIPMGGSTQKRTVDLSTSPRTEAPSTRSRQSQVDMSKGGQDINKPLLVGAAGTGIALGSQNANAAQSVNMDKIYKIESSGNPNAYNAKTQARGLGQITPIVLKEWNANHPEETYTVKKLFNAETNKKISDWYMNEKIPTYLRAYKIPDTTENRLVAYNAGIKTLKDKSPLKPETISYIRKFKRSA